MRARAIWVASFLWIASVPAGAQYGADACLDAARSLVRQQARWNERDDLRSRSREVRYWEAADGTRGSCRYDSRGRVYEVRVEGWGRDGSGWPGEPGRLGLTEEYGFDRRGSDYTSLATRTLAECQAACRDDSRCQAYTFSAREGRCWLKSRVNAQQVNRDMVTGYKTEEGRGDHDGGWGGGWGTLSEEWHYDRRGNDYTSFRTPRLADCKAACTREDRCRAYTFDTRSGTCYLKDRANTPQANEGMVTGFKQ